MALPYLGPFVRIADPPSQRALQSPSTTTTTIIIAQMMSIGGRESPRHNAFYKELPRETRY